MEEKLSVAQKQTLTEAQVRAILETAVEGIITIDADGIVLSFNHAAENMFGYEANEVIGNNITMLMTSPHREKHDSYIDHYIDTGEKRIIGIGREVPALRKSGDIFPMKLAVSEVRVGSMRTFAGVVTDLTEQKQLERTVWQNQEQLAHYDRLDMMGEMATGVAHEINQPLTAIATYAQASQRLIKSGKHTQTEMLEVLGEIGKQAERAGEIIQGIRQLSKKSRGEREVTEINKVLNSTMSLAKLDNRAQNIEWHIDLAAGLAPVEIYVIQIQQVILNLIRNALDAMPQGGKLTLRTYEADPEWIGVAVEDNGPGMNQSIADRVYYPFFTTKKDGMGMGLTICNSIVSAHGGQLEFSSAPGSGARFSFKLPHALDTNEPVF